MMTSIRLQGGLGNQLFQMAACISYAIKRKMDYAIPMKVHNPHYVKDNDNIKPYVFAGVNYCDKELDLPVYTEPAFTYSEIPYMKDICLNGYFQSFKYIGEYRKEILKAFGMNNIETRTGWVSIHIRRCDYISLPDYHPTVTMDYLLEALDMFVWLGFENYLVFGDDPQWNKENLNSDTVFGISKERAMKVGCNFLYAEGNSELEDFKLMAACQHNIIANSTFSLFAAYCNPNPHKITAAPKKWFGPAMDNNTKDLYLPNSYIL